MPAAASCSTSSSDRKLDQAAAVMPYAPSPVNPTADAKKDGNFDAPILVSQLMQAAHKITQAVAGCLGV